VRSSHVKQRRSKERKKKGNKDRDRGIIRVKKRHWFYCLNLSDEDGEVGGGGPGDGGYWAGGQKTIAGTRWGVDCGQGE